MKNKMQLAASFIKDSDAILIGAGAGLGKDSGLPIFRGNQGFWNNYPPYRGKFDFYDCANPLFLQRQPNLFWGFYGSRLQIYRKTIPHKGFQIMQDISIKQGKQIFVLTSNVDGHLQKAGYSEQTFCEIHGSINFLQCDQCQRLQTNDFSPEINYEKMRCQNLPFCLKCKSIRRPNILMFNDYSWMSQRTDNQEKNYTNFVKRTKQKSKSLCLIEIGAGSGIPTIRNMMKSNYRKFNRSKYIRINPQKEDNSQFNHSRFVHLQLGSLQALVGIKSLINIDNT